MTPEWRTLVGDARRLLAISLLAALLSMSAAGPGRSTDAQPLTFGDELQQILEDGVRASNGLGVSAAVIAAGHEPWTGVAGHSIRSNAALVPMRPDMLFEIGSVAKNLVTVVTLQLVDEGRFSLDDPVARWFPGYSQIPATATVRDLIGSTSGIAEWVDNPDSLFQPPFDPQKLARSWSVDEMLASLGPPGFAPGELWRYSTTGFRLAREIDEIETGQPIAALIQSRLLDPLGITDMWLEPSWPIPSRYPVAHEWFDTDGDGNLDDITDLPKPAFSDLKSAPVYSDAIDLARYCQALFHDGTLLGDDDLAAMLDFRLADDPQEPMAASYGLGTGTFNIPGLSGGIEMYGHGGNGIGYVVAMLYLPQREASVVIMTNDRGATMGTTAAAFLEAVDRGLNETAPPFFVISAFLLQILLVADFAARRWRPQLERRYGWVIYALGAPSVGVAIYLALSGAPWYQPLAFGIFAAWGLFGAWVDYLRPVAWRSPPRWPVFGPYVVLFVAAQFAFWIPLWYVSSLLWIAFGALYAVQTGLNVASHVRPRG